jgi:inosine-uridine nucleoside N-ribohydrolase
LTAWIQDAPLVSMDLLFDMETRDPDDALTLCLVATHPGVRLLGVTVNPGTPSQIGVVRHLLKRTGREDVRVGARTPKADREAVSPFHRTWLGELPSAEADAIAHELMAETLTRNPETVLLTGAPLHNVRLLLNQHPSVVIDRWVAQGGFAGDNLVPPHLRLPEFEGMTSCLSFNFNGDKRGTQLALDSKQIRRRELVSKNVTHGLIYDAGFHARLAPYRTATAGLALIYEAMEHYLQENPLGKMLHDPLAACVAIEPAIATLVEIEVVYTEGRWGSREASGTGTFITIDVDRQRFFETFVRAAPRNDSPPA